MKKNLPPSTLDQLSPPNKSFRHFENFQTNAFKQDASDFEMVNAWWLSEAALLAYGDEGFVNRTFEDAGLKAAGFVLRVLGEHNVQGFVAHNDQFIIVSFRGTEIDNFWGSAMDVATDLKFILVPDGAGGLVHHGFNNSVNFIWDALAAHLKQIQSDGGTRTLWFTGHSLGAAIATLAADRAIRLSGLEVKGLYTFGSPRVGDGVFKNRLTDEGLAARTYRFVNNNDIICKVPPRIAYRHIGTLKFIDNSGHLHSLEDETMFMGEADVSQSSNPFLQQFHFLGHILGQPKIVPGFLADHAPIYYALHVWNNYNP